MLRTLVGEADLLFGNHRDAALLLGRPFDGDTADAFAAGILHGVTTAEPQHGLETALALAVLKHYVPGDASTTTPADVDAFLSGQRDVRR